VPRPARGVPAIKAFADVRRLGVLAWQREEPAAPADLRHGVRIEGRLDVPEDAQEAASRSRKIGGTSIVLDRRNDQRGLVPGIPRARIATNRDVLARGALAHGYELVGSPHASDEL
jgi:hypothetical protein